MCVPLTHTPDSSTPVLLPLVSRDKGESGAGDSPGPQQQLRLRSSTLQHARASHSADALGLHGISVRVLGNKQWQGPHQQQPKRQGQQQAQQPQAPAQPSSTDLVLRLVRTPSDALAQVCMRV